MRQCSYFCSRVIQKPDVGWMASPVVLLRVSYVVAGCLLLRFVSHFCRAVSKVIQKPDVGWMASPVVLLRVSYVVAGCLLSAVALCFSFLSCRPVFLSLPNCFFFPFRIFFLLIQMLFLFIFYCKNYYSLLLAFLYIS